MIFIRVNRSHRFNPIDNFLTRHWPKGERLIACALGKQPEEIWPSRYQSMSPNHGEGEAG
ncbi:helix-turn-helix domain-containing protein [Pectobacterium brasiliense]|nr:helix-turn-helix domain-containing protein [Pectobacterium brasiliense]MBN3131971.1 helix-turn-helix domain-containing protein [Pectobacterium brasiliense]